MHRRGTRFLYSTESILLCPFDFYFAPSLLTLPYIYFSNVVSELLWWYIFMQILVGSDHFSLSLFF